jgi:phage tail sheath protein FI
MVAFNAVGRAPGVYIQEVPVAGPIAGVGTSTAAFVGPARKGPLNVPTFITNWSQFVRAFGASDDLGPYILTPPVCVTHAVRGFFSNGGTHCYFVRVGTAKGSFKDLKDKNGVTTLVVRAREEGTAGDSIKVEVQAASIVASGAPAKVVRTNPVLGLASAAKSTNEAQLPNATDTQAFRPGDRVLLEEGVNKEEVTIERISGATLILRELLANAYTSAGKIRIGDLKPNDKRLRLDRVVGVEPGSYVNIVSGATKESRVVASVDRANGAIILRDQLANSYSLAAGATDVTLTTQEFTLVVTPAGSSPTPEVYKNLSMDALHPRYFSAITADSPTVEVSLPEPPNTSVPPDNVPAVAAAAALGGGAQDDVPSLGTAHYQAGIDALNNVDDVNLLCVPDRTDQAVQAYMIQHCETLQDRFAILDPQRGATPFQGMPAQRNGLATDGGYAALYYPWVQIANPVAEGFLLVPPSGHIAGVYARVDDTRGVHKAPANETLRGVLDLERVLSDADQGPLNDLGINVIRSFSGSGIRVWGARTLSTRTQWRYVNVRRLLLFIEESIQEGTQFAVFEPNDLGLRQKVIRLVSGFLTRVW